VKTLIISILVLSAVNTNGQTSVYHPFPDSNAVWNFDYSYYDDMEFVNYQRSITIGGDTIINNLAYKILVGGGGGAFRQDTAARKVYYVPPGEPGGEFEHLLYDFNMEVGDIVESYIINYTVFNVDSILVGNTYRKMIDFGTGADIRIIEGVGSTYGLLRELNPNPVAIDYFLVQLICFKENGDILLPPSSSECQLISDIQQVEEEAVNPLVFPNPTNGQIRIDLGQILDNATLNIYNPVGGLVHTQQLNNKQYINHKINGAKGIYLLQLVDQDGGTANYKLIKE
jgi:hypothetical protein